jgi:dienelactone hydrolase
VEVSAVADPAPLLSHYADPRRPRGVVLMLHGGQQHGHQAVDHRSTSWVRSVVMARAIARRAAALDVAVALLRYRHRGWNDGRGPVADARWALAQLRSRYGEVPVVLLGHSMGARTAVRAADDASVRGVVALAPWLPAGEPVAALAGKRLVAAHGTRDRITSARATQDFVDRAARAGADASYVDMGDVGHYLLRRMGRWNALALERSLDVLG